VQAYISHRLAVAGQHVKIFPDKSIKLIYRLSKGVPRLINVICDRALLGAYVENQYIVEPAIVKKAAKEVFGELKTADTYQRSKKNSLALETIIAIFIVAVSALLTYLYYTNNIPGMQQPVSTDTGLQETTLTANNNESSGTLQTAEPATEQTTPEDHTTRIDSPAPATAPDNTETIASAEKQVESLPAAAGETTVTESEYADINSLINNAPVNPRSAYEALFSAWELHYNDRAPVTACKQAEVYGLRCLYANGNLNSLKTHNRPALLTIADSQGNKRYITITAFEKDQATVFSENQPYTVKLSELDSYWYGQFILLWHKPEYYTTAITPGKSGKIVSWLYDSLSGITDLPAGRSSDVYDYYLVGKVKAFQLQQGLAPDGIVGPLTILYINALTKPGIPVLKPTTSPINKQV
jgi:general secretion pathway protein A